MRRILLAFVTVVALNLCHGVAVAEEPGACELLADSWVRMRISPTLESKLVFLCGTDEAAQPPEPLGSSSSVVPLAAEAVIAQEAVGGLDILVNDPASDIGGTTQSETSIVASGDVVCAAWNDLGEPVGSSGFAYSHDHGLSFTDGGPFPIGQGVDTNFGDPSLAYDARTGTYYYAALSLAGLSLWASTDACQSFDYVGPIHVGNGDDKELMTVDNSPLSPYYGRIYVGWTNFAIGFDLNQTTYSDDGGLSWTQPISLPGSGGSGQGMWPAAAPNGDVYFAVLNRSFSTGGFQDQWIYKSVDGGNSWTQMTDIGTNQLRPEDIGSSLRCLRQALNGDIRNLSSPQIVIHGDLSAPAGYVVHTVYSYDSDGAGPDSSNVFYRRSLDGAVSWSVETMLNDDTTTTDQWYPAVGVNDEGIVTVSWYDRRLDPALNLAFDRFVSISIDGGETFGENLRISDESSPVSQNLPHFDGLAPCYHGDYDQVVVDGSSAHILWSDDRRITGTGPNPDIYYDQVDLGVAIDIDASLEFPFNLFGISPAAIYSPLPFELPATPEDPIVGRTEAFDVVLELSSGTYLAPLPSVGPEDSDAQIRMGSALGGAATGWTIEILEGESGDPTIVLRISPLPSATPVTVGSLLLVDGHSFLIDSLNESLDAPGQRLWLRAGFEDSQTGEVIQETGVLMVRTISGTFVLGEEVLIDNIGELDSTGSRTIFRSGVTTLGVQGHCDGFPDGDFAQSLNCTDDLFHLDPVNDVVVVQVLGDDLDPFLASPDGGIGVVAGLDCESSPLLASVSGPMPPGQTEVELSFSPNSTEGESFSVCLIQDALTAVPVQFIRIEVSVVYSSIYLIPSPEGFARINIAERCFGDFNEDGRVNNTDALFFRACFPCSGPGCNRTCDFDLDGNVNNLDALAFRKNFGSECPPPPTYPYPYPLNLAIFGEASVQLAGAGLIVLVFVLMGSRRKRTGACSDAGLKRISEVE